METGTEENFTWRLLISISRKQRKWAGSFTFCENKKLHKHKSVHLAGGVVKGREWQLSLNVSALQKQPNYAGNFYFKFGGGSAKEQRLVHQNYMAENPDSRPNFAEVIR
jgi:hypothetical protein